MVSSMETNGSFQESLNALLGRCCVMSCPNSFYYKNLKEPPPKFEMKDEYKVMFPLPTDVKRFNKWKRNIPTQLELDFENRKIYNYHICSSHFRQDDMFKKPYTSVADMGGNIELETKYFTYLKQDAVPVYFDNASGVTKYLADINKGKKKTTKKRQAPELPSILKKAKEKTKSGNVEETEYDDDQYLPTGVVTPTGSPVMFEPYSPVYKESDDDIEFADQSHQLHSSGATSAQGEFVLTTIVNTSSLSPVDLSPYSYSRPSSGNVNSIASKTTPVATTSSAYKAIDLPPSNPNHEFVDMLTEDLDSQRTLTYELFIEKSSEISLPSCQWAVQKHPTNKFVSFSFVDVHPSGCLSEKRVIFHGDLKPKVWLDGVFKDNFDLKEVTTIYNCTKLLLNLHNMIPCPGTDHPVEPSSMRCYIYMNSKQKRCAACKTKRFSLKRKDIYRLQQSKEGVAANEQLAETSPNKAGPSKENTAPPDGETSLETLIMAAANAELFSQQKELLSIINPLISS